MEDQQIKFGVECPASVKRALKIAAARRDISLKDAYEEAFRLWAEDADLTENLGIVLRDGNEAMRDEARRLLKGLALKVRALQSVPEPERETKARVGRR